MHRITKRVLLVFLIIGIVCAGSLFHMLQANCVVREGVIRIPTGATFQTLLDSLDSGGKRIKHRPAFRRYARHIGLDRSVKPGHYVLQKGMDVKEVARMFNLGLQTPINVVINNVRTPQQLAGKLATQIEADSVSILQALTDSSIVAQSGFRSPLELFSIFIPNTYQFYWTVKPTDFIGRMQREYDRFWTEERQKALEKTGLTRMEAITLASIVYEETRKGDEMPTIAGVYMNRLRRGMPLQADPTVKYATGDFSLRRILKKHLRIDSPYNTYRNKGLPPTPICMPSIQAIDAVLHYGHHNYLYFCAKEDFSGYHNFAASYSEHLRNARRYTAELNRRGIR